MSKAYILVISRYYHVALMHGILEQVGKNKVYTGLTITGSRWCGGAAPSSR